MTDELQWPRCKCGHIAQDHNVLTGESPKNYGCDVCAKTGRSCMSYRYPDDFPQEKRDILEARREHILNDYPPTNRQIIRVLVAHEIEVDIEDHTLEDFVDSFDNTLQDETDIGFETSDEKFNYVRKASERILTGSTTGFVAYLVRNFPEVVSYIQKAAIGADRRGQRP